MQRSVLYDDLNPNGLSDVDKYSTHFNNKTDSSILETIVASAIGL